METKTVKSDYVVTIFVVMIILFIAIIAYDIQEKIYPQKNTAEEYYQNFLVSTPQQNFVIASKPFKITNGIWAYLAGPNNGEYKLKYYTVIYSNTNKLRIKQKIKVIKFHGSDNYGYFGISQ